MQVLKWGSGRNDVLEDMRRNRMCNGARTGIGQESLPYLFSSLHRHISHFIHNVPFPSPQRPRILVQVRADPGAGLDRRRELAGASHQHPDPWFFCSPRCLLMTTCSSVNLYPHPYPSGMCPGWREGTFDDTGCNRYQAGGCSY
jgi:hypothetical protein